MKRIKALMGKILRAIVAYKWVLLAPLVPVAMTGFFIGIIVVPFYRGLIRAGEWIDSFE